MRTSVLHPLAVGLGGLVLVLFACRKTSAPVEVDAGRAIETSTGVAPSSGIVFTPSPHVRSEPPPDPRTSAVLAWNAALGAHDADALGRLYGAKVKLYGKSLTRAEAVAAKKKAFARQKDFSQIVAGVRLEDGRATFTKIVTADKTTKSYAAYLVFAPSDGGKPEIVEESDATTDANLKSSADEACLTAAAGAALASDKVAKSLGEPLGPELVDAGCTSHGLMPMPHEAGEPFVEVKLHTSCADRLAFRGWVFVSVADGCVYEDPDTSGDPTHYAKLQCTPDAAAVRARCGGD